MKRRKKILVISMTTFLVVLFDCSKDETIINISGTATDIDGNTYKTITIGTQIWIAENLKVTKYPNGEEILLVTDNDAWRALGDNDSDDAYCYINDDSTSQFGALYTYAAAKDVCPAGWHLPSFDEWKTLESFISDNGHNGTEGTALKTTSGWKHNGNGTDNFGFSALPGGLCGITWCVPGPAGYDGYWWSSTQVEINKAYVFSLHDDASDLDHSGTHKSNGFSVRCIKD